MQLGELVNARGLTNKIRLTRLMVGHTHEDIDGKFALIWKKIRSAHVLSPNEYVKFIKYACSKEATEVVDVFSIPDYSSYIKQFIDPDFER